MAVLVLGAGGFVGGYIASFLQKDGQETFTLSRKTAPNRRNHTFQVGPNGELETEKLLDFFLEKEINHVVHCANKFARNPSFSVANEMLLVNYLLPAKVLRVAIEVSAQSFINLGSAWQVTQERLVDAPDYISSKEAFRKYLDLNANPIRARTLFLNDIFGAADPREKLINRAFRCAINNEAFDVDSETLQLGLVYLPRLASEISGVISGGLDRPLSYLYENYSGIMMKELMEDIRNLLGVGKFWSNLNLNPKPNSFPGLPTYGQCDRESLARDLAALVPSGRSPNPT